MNSADILSVPYSQEIMDKVNNFTRRRLTPEEVYLFPLVLCDNEVDRDGERFSLSALNALAEMFVGKTGIFDHNAAVSGQTSRIFHTEVETQPQQLTSAGEPYTCVKALAYMVRCPQNESLIAEIDGGIKKEVSISCSVAKKICSVCGKDKDGCPHRAGESYNGKECHIILEQPTDAFEWSFVAVPAQKNAGVYKSAKPDSGLQSQVTALLYNCDTVLPTWAIETLVEKMPEQKLIKLKDRLQKQLAKRAEPQLAAALRSSAKSKPSSFSLGGKNNFKF